MGASDSVCGYKKKAANGVKRRRLRGKWPTRMGIKEEDLVEVAANGRK
jgi:hypothetical protein